jgi:hypothetical protein
MWVDGGNFSISLEFLIESIVVDNLRTQLGMLCKKGAQFFGC